MEARSEKRKSSDIAGRSPLAGNTSSARDFIVLIAGALLVLIVSIRFDVFNRIIGWVYRHDTLQLDELFAVAVYLVVAVSIYAWRRHKEALRNMALRRQAEEEKAVLLPELERALSDVSALRMLLPMCSSCKRVRDSQDHWYFVEVYIESHLPAKIDGGLCPDCAREKYVGPGTPSHT
jgi:hypothetical protein